MKKNKRRRIRMKRVLLIPLLLITIFKPYDVYATHFQYQSYDIDFTPIDTHTQTTVDLLLLVNQINPIPEDYYIDLYEFQNEMVARIMVNDLQEMYKEAAKDKIYLKMTSTYRSKEQQKVLYEQTILKYTQLGNTYHYALEKAKKEVASPGYSEHETGLVIDFSDTSSVNKRIAMWEWLATHAHQYGFILRFPEGCEDITGIAYEPWHYRYVGKENAILIYESGLTLEEYLKQR